MKISMVTTPFWNLPFEKASERIADLGYRGVEVVAFRPHCFPKDYSRKGRKDLRELLASRGLQVAALAQGAFWGTAEPPNLNASSFLDEEQKDSLRYSRACLEFAAALEAKILLFQPGTIVMDGMKKTKNHRERAWQKVKGNLQKLGDLAKDLGVVIAIEAGPTEASLVPTPNEELRMITEVDSNNVKGCLNVGRLNLLKRGSIQSYVKRMRNVTVHVRVSDNDGRTESRLPVGMGSIDWNEVLTALKSTLYDGYLSVDLPGVVHGTRDSFREGYALTARENIEGVLRLIGAM